MALGPRQASGSQCVEWGCHSSPRTWAGPVTWSAGTLRGVGRHGGAARSGAQLTAGVSTTGSAPGTRLKLSSPLLALSPSEFRGSPRNRSAVRGPPPPTSGQQLHLEHPLVSAARLPASWDLGAWGPSSLAGCWEACCLRRSGQGCEVRRQEGKQGVGGGPGQRWGPCAGGAPAEHSPACRWATCSEPAPQEGPRLGGNPSAPRVDSSVCGSLSKPARGPTPMSRGQTKAMAPPRLHPRQPPEKQAL